MLGMNAATGERLGGVDHLAQSIADILTTPIGTRVMRRDYGSRLPELVDAPAGPGLAVELIAATAEAIDRWEPRYRLPVFTSAGLAAIEAAHAQGLSVKITHLALGDGAYDVRDVNGVALASARARVALDNERVRVALSAGGALGTNQVLVEAIVAGGVPEFWIKEVGFIAEDGTLLCIWSSATSNLGYRGTADWVFRYVLAWTDLPADAITVVYDGDAAYTALSIDHERLEAKVRHTVASGELVWDDGDDTQLTVAIAKMIAAGAHAVVLNAATFAPGVVDGNVVRWDAGNSRFALAIADGTTNNQAVGFADVTNSAVYCFGTTRAMLAALTPGSRYYLSGTVAGAVTTTAPADVVLVGIAKAADTLFVDIDPGSALTGYARLDTAQTWTKAQRSTPVQIVDGASPAIDLSLSNVFYWTLAGNRTMPAPTNAVAGQSGVIWLTQDGTGSRTLAYNTFWRFAGGTIPTASTAAAAKDCLVYEVSEDGTWALCSLSKGAA